MLKLESKIEKFDPSDILTEDSGAAKIYLGGGFIAPNSVEGDENQEGKGLFFRIHSWDEEKQHIDFESLVGKNIKVIIEIS